MPADRQYAESLAEATYAGASFTQIGSLAWTPPATADYVVLVQLELKCSVAGSAVNYVNVRLQQNDAVDVRNFTFTPQTTDTYLPLTLVAKVSFASGGARRLDLDVRVVGSATATYRNVTVLAWAVPIAFSGTLTNVDTTDSPALTVDMTLGGGASAGDYLILWGGLYAPVSLGQSVFMQLLFLLPKSDDPGNSWQLAQPGYTALAAGFSMPFAGFAVMTVGTDDTPQLVLYFANSNFGTAVHVDAVDIIVIKTSTATDLGHVGQASDHYRGGEESPPETSVSGGTTLPAPSNGTIALTYPAQAQRHLLLATAHIGSPDLGASAQVDYQLAGTEYVIGALGSPAVYRPSGPLDELHSFMAFRLKTLPAGTYTDALRFAPQASGGVMVTQYERLLALEVVLSAGPSEDLTLTETLQDLLSSVIPGETLTLADTAAVSELLSAGVTLSDLVTAVFTRGVADVVMATDAVLALIVPPPDVRPRYGPVQLIEFFFASGTRRVTHRDLYLTHPTGGWSDTLFAGDLLAEPPEIPNAFVDPLHLIQDLEAFDVTVRNGRGQWSFLRTEDCRGIRVLAWAWDPLNNELELISSARITSRELGFQTVFHIARQSPGLMAMELPPHKVTTAEFALARDVGAAIPICIGARKKVRSLLTRADAPNKIWQYVFADRVGTSATTFNQPVTMEILAVYRNGVLVDPSEYAYTVSGNTTTSGGGVLHDLTQAYGVVTFVRDQGDAVITLDVRPTNAALRNPAWVANFLYGSVAGEQCDLGRFAFAADRFDTVLYPTAQFHLDLYIDDTLTFADVLADVLFRLRVERDQSGLWFPEVDEMPTSAALQAGLGPGTVGNILQGSLTALTHASIEDTPSAFRFEYNFSRGFLQDQAAFLSHKLLPGIGPSAVASASAGIQSNAPLPDQPTGAGEKLMQNPYITENYAADAVLQFLAGETITFDEKLAFSMGMEARHVKLRAIVLVHIPHPAYALIQEPYRAIGVTRGRNHFALQLAHFSAAIYQFARNASSDDPAAIDVSIADLSFTPPPILASLGVPNTDTTGWVVTQGTEGAARARVTVTARVPPATPADRNGTHVVFKYRQHDLAIDPLSDALLSTEVAAVPIGPEKWDPANASGRDVVQVIDNLTPGLAYDFYAFIRNVNNKGGLTPDAQNGPVVVNANGPDGWVAPGDAQAPLTTSPSGAKITVSVTQGTGAALEIRINLPADYVIPQDFKEAKLYRATGSSPSFNSAALVDRSPKLVFTDLNINHTSTYHYWVVLADRSNNASAPIGSAGVVNPASGGTGASGTFKTVDTADITPGAVTHTQEVSFPLGSSVGIPTNAVDGYQTMIQLPAGGTISFDTETVYVDINFVLGVLNADVQDEVWIRVLANSTTLLERRIMKGYNSSGLAQVLIPTSFKKLTAGVLSGTYVFKLQARATDASITGGAALAPSMTDPVIAFAAYKR